MKQRTKKRISTFLALLLSLAMVMPAMNGVTLTAKAAEYVGDWREGFSVAASEFANITGESMVCIDYTVVEESEAYQFKLNNKLDEWVPLEEDAFTYLEYEINEWGFTDVPDTDSRAVVVLSADAVAALAEGDGLCVQVFGLIIDNVTVIDGLNLGRTWELDSSYPEPEEWGGYVSAMIPVEALLQFDGAVAVTLDYVATGESEWPWFGVQSAQWNPLTPRGNVTANNGEGTLTFVLEQEDIAAAIEDGGIMFNLGDVYFTEARLAEATPDDYYVGDYNEGFLLPKSAFDGFTDGASLSIDYRIVTDEAYTNNNGFLLINTSDWYAFEEEDYTYLEYPINEYLFINVPATDSNVKVSLSADAVEKIVAGDSLRVEVFGLIIEDVTVEAPIVDNSIVMLDEAFPEADADGDVMSAVIPAEKLLAFEGPVAITLSYQATGESAWAWYEVLTVEKNALTPEGCVYAEQETGTVTIVLDEEDIEKAAEEGGVAFRLHDVFFTKAKLSVPAPDDYYAGDWKDGHAVPASEFEGMENGATLLIDYRTVSGYESYQYKLNNNLDSWVPFTEEDYTYMEYGINEYGFTDVPDNDSRAVVVLNADAVAALTEGNGLTVQVFGVIIENVTVIDGLVTDREFILDSSYPEADEWGSVLSSVIPAEALLQFDGPVAVTLDYVATGENEWPGFSTKTIEWRELTPEGNVTVSNGEGTITLVLDEEDIAAAIADGGIMFYLDGVYFTEARLDEAEAEDYYVGDWNEGYTISKDAFQDITGGAMITIDYATLSSDVYEYYQFTLINKNSDWLTFKGNDYTFTEYDVNEWDWINVPDTDSKVIVALSEDAVEKIADDGIRVEVFGLMIDNVTVEPVLDDTTFDMDSNYGEENELGGLSSSVIPPEALVQFNGPVAVTLDYKKTENADYSWFIAATRDWKDLNPKGNTTIGGEEGTITFVLEEEDIAAAVAGGGLWFHLFDVYFTEARLSEAKPDDYYVGEWNPAYTFEASELQGLSGDIVLTLKYYTTVSYDYEWFYIWLTDFSDWHDLPAEAYIGSEVVDEGTGKIWVNRYLNEMTITIKEEAFQQIVANGGGFGVRGNGVIVEEATLEKLEYTDATGRTGNVVMDASNPSLQWIRIEDGAPADGNVYLMTYEIYDEEGTFAGTLEYRTGSKTMSNAWIIIGEKTEMVGRTEQYTSPWIEAVWWCYYFPEEEVETYNQYTYKVTGQKLLTEKMPTTTPRWDTSRSPGWMVWDPVEGATGYSYKLKHNGNPWEWGKVGSGFLENNVRHYIDTNGSYTIEVTVIGDREHCDSEVAISQPYEYTRPEKVIPMPEKIWWTAAEGSEIPSIINWTPVEGAMGYEVSMEAYDARYPNGSAVDFAGSIYYNTAEDGLCTYCDFTEAIQRINESGAEEGISYIYKVEVRAISGNIEIYANSDRLESKPSGEYKTLEAIEQELKENIQEDGLDAVIEASGIKEVADAMKNNAEVLEEVVEEEQKHREKNGVLGALLNFVEEIVTESIRIVGAALNVESGSYNISFNEAESKMKIDRELYHNPMQVDISLDTEDGKVSELKVPVVITMEAPKNIAKDRLVILHEHNGIVESIFPSFNDDGTISFATTGFSTFAFAGINLYDDNGMEEVSNEGDFGDEPEPTPSPSPTPTPDPVEAFVERLYSEIMGRDADSGLDYWVGELKNGTKTGAEVAAGFVLSEEFLEKEITDAEFIQIMYRTFFDRDADEDGLAWWLGAMNNGKSKQEAFAGFVNSDEFGDVCDAYGIVQGSVSLPEEQEPEEPTVSQFVKRLYSEIMGRDADEGGLSYWVSELEGQKQTGAKAAEGFILSEEFQNKAMTNAEYIGIMYRTFFGRSADEGGLAWWLSEMENGKSKSSVFAGFANSGEFGELCETYGIIQGSITEPTEEPGPTPEPTVSEFVKRLYSEIMGRDADEGGLSYWVGELEAQNKTGAEAAAGFIMSEEFQGKEMTDAEYICIMYRTFFGREADEDGLAWWLGEMENGKSKFLVFAGFANSSEFGELCEMYGITQGEVTAE